MEERWTETLLLPIGIFTAVVLVALVILSLRSNRRARKRGGGDAAGDDGGYRGVGRGGGADQHRRGISSRSGNA